MKRSIFTTNQIIHRGYLPPAVEPGQIWLVIKFIVTDSFPWIRAYPKNFIYINKKHSETLWDISVMNPGYSHSISGLLDEHSKKPQPSYYLSTNTLYQHCSFVA